MSKNPMIRFQQRDNDNAGTAGGGGNSKPKFVLSGQELSNKSEVLRDEMNSLNEEWEVHNNYNFSKPVEVKIIDRAKAKGHQANIVKLFSLTTSNFNQLGMEDDDTLILKIKTQEDLNSIRQRLEDTSSFDIEISAIDSILPYTPVTDYDQNFSKYKVFFLNFNNDFENKNSRKYVLEQLEQHNIAFEVNKYGKEDIITLDEITEDKLSFVRKLPIKSITPLEETEDLFHINFNDDSDLFSKMDSIKYDASIDYPIVGLLDNGVELNDYTKDWVSLGKGCQYEESELDKSHGTFIASLLIYGDAMNNADDYDIAGCRIVDCPIIPNYSINELELINNIRIAIAENPEVKIWSLSVSINKEVDSNEFSEFAKELDVIQKEFNVLIIKSAGNDPSNIGRDELPRKINHGADSIRALTVGSINRTENSSYNLLKNAPSDYSRMGKGPAFIIKPELVHYGGDYYLEDDNSVAISELGFSTNNRFMNQGGTSFSTPKVAKNISQVNNLMIDEEFSPLLLKALAIHSALYDEKLEISEEDRISRLGFGLPQRPTQILDTEDYAITLVLNGELQKSSLIDIMDFPYPESLVDEDGYYYGRIKVTLVYEPYLAKDLGNEYCQNHIDLKIGTYDEKEDVEGRYAIFNPIKRVGSQNLLTNALYSKKALKDNYLYEKTRIEYGDKYQSIKSYSIDLSELTPAKKRDYMKSERDWYLFLDSEYRNYVINELEKRNQIPHTPFSLIITIEDPYKEKNVYHDTINKLNQNNFVHNEINTEIHLDVE